MCIYIYSRGCPEEESVPFIVSFILVDGLYERVIYTCIYIYIIYSIPQYIIMQDIVNTSALIF